MQVATSDSSFFLAASSAYIYIFFASAMMQVPNLLGAVRGGGASSATTSLRPHFPHAMRGLMAGESNQLPCLPNRSDQQSNTGSIFAKLLLSRPIEHRFCDRGTVPSDPFMGSCEPTSSPPSFQSGKQLRVFCVRQNGQSGASGSSQSEHDGRRVAVADETPTPQPS